MKTWYIAGLLLLVSYGLCAYGDIEEAADEFLDNMTDTIIDSYDSETDEGTRDITRAAARAVFNPFSDRGFDDMEQAVEDYFDTADYGSQPSSSSASESMASRRPKSQASIKAIIGATARIRSNTDDILYFANGDKIYGRIAGNSIAIVASFGTMNVPVEDLDIIMFGKSNHYYLFRSGDKVKGADSNDMLLFDASSIGRINVPTNDIRFVLIRG